MVYFAGIDLAARSSQVCVIDDDQQVLVNRKIPNDLTALDEVLEPYRGDLRTVVEASFNWYWIVDHLVEIGCQTTLAHPVRLKAITSAKVKTDKRDAAWLARLLRGGLIPESHICPLDQRRLRDLCRLRWDLSQQRGTSLRKVRQVLANEGMHTISKQEIRHLDIEATDIDPMVQVTCHIRQSQQDHIDRCLEILDEAIGERVSQLTDLKDAITAIRTVPGFGPVNAATIVLESGDISRFGSVKGYASHCRLAPGVAQSGESSKRGRMNKAGNEHLKRAYTNAAMVAARTSPLIRKFRDHHRARRASHAACNLIVNNIIAHKMAVAIYCMLTRGEPWQEEKSFTIR